MHDMENYPVAISPAQKEEKKEECGNHLSYLGNHDFKSYSKSKEHKQNQKQTTFLKFFKDHISSQLIPSQICKFGSSHFTFKNFKENKDALTLSKSTLIAEIFMS